MPFLRPILQQLRQQALDDLTAGPGADGVGLLRFDISRVLSWVIANLSHGTYGYLDWVARQSVPWTATDEYLEAWAGLVGVRRKAASQAAGTWASTGNPGTPLPVGSALARQDGAAFVTTAAAAVVSNGTIQVPIQAVTPGTDGNCAVGTPFSLSPGVAGINAAGVAVAAVAQGADDEGDDSLRTRMLLRWAAPPQGGSVTDYQEWALEVPGVTRAWDLPRGMGPGTVVVYTMWDDAEAANGGFPQGRAGVAGAEDRDIPATGDLLAVADALLPLQPVTALVYSVAPLAYPVPFAVTTPRPVPAATQAATAAALASVFLALADPLGGILPIGPFDAALTAALGTPLFTLTAPGGPIEVPVGRLPVLGPMTWSVPGG